MKLKIYTQIPAKGGLGPRLAFCVLGEEGFLYSRNLVFIDF